MRPRTKTLPIEKQADLVLQAIQDLGGHLITFRAISEKLGTDDLTMFRQGLNLLLEQNKIVQHGVKRGASYALKDSSVQVQSEVIEAVQPEVSVCSSNLADIFEQFLVQTVADGRGYTNEELAQKMLSRFQGRTIDHLERIKRVARAGLIGYVRERRDATGMRVFYVPLDKMEPAHEQV